MTILAKKRIARHGSVHQESLPYEENALAPYLSSQTLNVHYGRHHKAYIEKINRLIEETDLESFSLKDIVLKSAGELDRKEIFNNAAQAWNHSFYWKSMKPGGGGRPGHELMEWIKSSFGGLEEFQEEFQRAAESHFGSGWIWLIKNNDRLEIAQTHDADNPLVHHEIPLLVLDVWEHAYYLDYQNKRPEYIQAFIEHLADWGFAESNLAGD